MDGCRYVGNLVGAVDAWMWMCMWWKVDEGADVGCSGTYVGGRWVEVDEVSLLGWWCGDVRVCGVCSRW